MMVMMMMMMMMIMIMYLLRISNDVSMKAFRSLIVDRIMIVVHRFQINRFEVWIRPSWSFDDDNDNDDNDNDEMIMIMIMMTMMMMIMLPAGTPRTFQ